MNPLSRQNLAHPVIVAPMAGGVSTPALVAAVANAGGFGFLAAGYQTVAQTAADIATLRDLTDRPFGVNIFVPQTHPVDRAAVDRYRAALRVEANRYGVELPEPPDSDDDGWGDKLDLMTAAGVPVVSFTFGCPPRQVVQTLRRKAITVVVTVTSAVEAALAAEAGADLLCVQGPNAGGHRGSFTPQVTAGPGLIDLIGAVRARVTLELIAAGGMMDGADLDAVLAAGASAGQFGTAFLRTPEAGTTPTHRRALADVSRGTCVTAAFTGRPARALTNRFTDTYSAVAPIAYPHVHHLTRGLRQAAAARADAEAMALWAGAGYPRGQELPAAELVDRLVRRTAIDRTT